MFAKKGAYLKIILLLLCLFSTVWAEDKHHLMSLDLEDKNYHAVFMIDRKGKCGFDQNSSVKSVLWHKNKGTEKLDFFEKIYFAVKEAKISEKEVSFSLAGSSNVRFFFSFKNCKLLKRLEIDREVMAFDKIAIDYTTTLGPPILKNFSVIHGEKSTKIYSYSLKGHIPFYELTAGPAVSLRTNLRPGNTRTLLKNDPIIEPIPAFLFRYGGFFINRDGAGHALFAYSGIVVLGSVFYDGERFRNPVYHERRNGFFVGPIVKWKGIQVKYVRDYFQRLRGEELKVTYSHEFRPSLKLKIIPRIYWQHWSKDYSDYYFGVADDEGGGNVKPYKLSSSNNFSAMCRIIYSQERFAYLADFGVKFLDKAVYRSPIVIKKAEQRLVLGVLYRIF